MLHVKNLDPFSHPESSTSNRRLSDFPRLDSAIRAHLTKKQKEAASQRAARINELAKPKKRVGFARNQEVQTKTEKTKKEQTASSKDLVGHALRSALKNRLENVNNEGNPWTTQEVVASGRGYVELKSMDLNLPITLLENSCPEEKMDCKTSEIIQNIGFVEENSATHQLPDLPIGVDANSSFVIEWRKKMSKIKSIPCTQKSISPHMFTRFNLVVPQIIECQKFIRGFLERKHFGQLKRFTFVSHFILLSALLFLKSHRIRCFYTWQKRFSMRLRWKIRYGEKWIRHGVLMIKRFSVPFQARSWFVKEGAYGMVEKYREWRLKVAFFLKWMKFMQQ